MKYAKIQKLKPMFKRLNGDIFRCLLQIYANLAIISALLASPIFLAQLSSLSHQSDDITIFPTLHSSTRGNYPSQCIRCIDQALCVRNTHKRSYTFATCKILRVKPIVLSCVNASLSPI